MRSGKLRHSVDLQRATQTRDAAGDVVRAWADIATHVPASIEPISSRERLTADQVVGEATHRVWLRWERRLSAVRAKDRVLFGTRVFEVSGPPINREERDRSIELMVKEEPG